MSHDEIKTSLSREKDFTLLTADGMQIYGRVNYAGDKPSPKAVVTSHGLTGYMNEYIHLMARDYFNERGYDVIRFNYYSSEKDARILKDCTLQTHAVDLNTVTNHFSPQYEKIFIAGHSYGGLTILLANPKANAVSFWDASFVPEFWKTEASYVPELDCYKIGWGSEKLAGKAMYQEAENLKENDSISMARALKCPAQVLLAGENNENTNRTLLFDSLKDPKDFYDVPGADHCFNKGKTVYDLLEKTHAWFERF